MPINFTDSPANGATITQGNSTFTYNSIKGVWNRTIGAASGLSEYATLSALPLVGVADDTLAKVLDTNKLYKWTGTGWYFLDPVNTNPTITTAGNAAYKLSTDWTPTIVTLAANDPEGFPIIWSYAITAGSLGSTATVSQADNVFTITPSIVDANAGDFTLTFTASDGVNIDTSTSEFSLTFSVANSKYTTLLAQAISTGTNSTFADASAEAHTVTNTGVIAGTVSPYSPSYSAYLDGSGDYFAINSGTVANFGTGDFTIEMWWNRKDAIDPGLVFESRPANTSGDYITLSILGANIAYYAGSGAVNISTPHNVSVGDWAHLAVVRTGGYVKVYVNGTQIATSADTINYLSGSTPWIGKNAFQPGDWTNVISLSNYRITKAAVYTDNFIPATQPLEAITGTTLLTFKSNRFVDNSGNNVGLTVYGNPEIVPESPFNRLEYSEAVHGSSGYFNGSSKLTLPSAASLQFGTGAFTIECWFNTTVSQQYTSLVSNETNSTGFTILLNPSTNSGSIVIYNGSAGLILSSLAGGYNDGAWHHIAYTRDGNSARLYLDGVIQQTNTGQATFAMDTGGTWNIGDSAAFSPRDYTGYISDFRVVKGTAVYTSAFTPLTAPVTAVANTTFLMNPNPSIIDKAQKNNITLVGNVTSASPPLQLFGTPNERVMTFDGNGDWVIVSDNSPDFGFGTGDFTMECWINPTTAGIQDVFSTLSNLNTAPHLYVDSSSQLVYYHTGSARITGGTITINQWHHIAVCRASNSTKLFVNGSQVGSTYSDTNNYGTSNPCVIGSFYNNGSIVGGANSMQGYIQDARVTKGLARYTANFTPPTALLEG